MAKAVEKTEPATHNEDPLLSLTHVANALGRHVATISRWVQDGILPVNYMPSGRPMVRKSTLMAWLNVTEFPKQPGNEQVEKKVIELEGEGPE